MKTKKRRSCLYLVATGGVPRNEDGEEADDYIALFWNLKLIEEH